MKRELVAVVVMGDIARSPRMLNHAGELASHGFDVVLIGYRGIEFEPPAGIRVLLLDGGRGAPRNVSRLGFVIHAGLRMGRLFIALLRILLREKPRAILVQNPPSFPTLTAARLAAKYTSAKVIVDWHNYGFSLLALRLSATHWLVRAARWYEFHAYGGEASHFCVSAAMRENLLRSGGIAADVLYDRPVAYSAGTVGPPGFVAVCPAGWTADEDMEVLLEALELISDHTLTIYVTGEGVKRKELDLRLQALRVRGILQDTGFLPEEEYWDLIRRADLGLSLHRSSSGLDLAMKVIDLFSAGVPVCALDYGGSIGEQIEEGVTGFLFRTAAELAALLTRLASNPALLPAMRISIGQRWAVPWNVEWTRTVLPVLEGIS